VLSSLIWGNRNHSLAHFQLAAALALLGKPRRGTLRCTKAAKPVGVFFRPWGQGGISRKA
jgi:hypothetical protein